MDHVVRTTTIELRKRPRSTERRRHRNELRLSLVPGSYIPRFALPTHPTSTSRTSFCRSTTFLPHRSRSSPLAPSPFGIDARFALTVPLVVLALAAIVFMGFRTSTAQDIFWRPVFDTPGSVLVAVGDVPNGPRPAAHTDDNEDPPSQPCRPPPHPLCPLPTR